MVLDYAGLRANELPNPRTRRLRDLVHLYVSNMDDGHARVKMDEVDRHLDNTWFAWIGGTQTGQRLLLPRPEPGDSDRVRPSAAGEPGASLRPILRSRPTSTSTAWCARRTETTTAKTCCGSTTSRIRTRAKNQ